MRPTGLISYVCSLRVFEIFPFIWRSGFFSYIQNVSCVESLIIRADLLAPHSTLPVQVRGDLNGPIFFGVGLRNCGMAVHRP